MPKLLVQKRLPELRWTIIVLSLIIIWFATRLLLELEGLSAKVQLQGKGFLLTLRHANCNVKVITIDFLQICRIAAKATPVLKENDHYIC